MKKQMEMNMTLILLLLMGMNLKNGVSQQFHKFQRIKNHIENQFVKPIDQNQLQNVYLLKKHIRNLQEVQKYKNWLSKIQNKIKISQLSIPGTHDSAAYNSTKWYHFFSSFVWKTQTLSFQQQLNKGVRFFDIRVKCSSNQDLTLYHDIIALGDFKKFINPMYTFLKQNPTQFLIVRFAKQQGEESQKICGNKIVKRLEEYSNLKQYKYAQNPGYIPTVGQLRGKILIIQSTGINLGQQIRFSTRQLITDHQLYAMQNYWNGPIQEKKQNFIAVMNKPKNLLRVNYLSQSTFPMLYSFIYNNWFRNICMKQKLKKVGIIIADFVDDIFLQAVIQSNF